MATLTVMLMLLGLGVLMAGLAVTVGGRTGQILGILAAVAGGVALASALVELLTT